MSAKSPVARCAPPVAPGTSAPTCRASRVCLCRTSAASRPTYRNATQSPPTATKASPWPRLAAGGIASDQRRDGGDPRRLEAKGRKGPLFLLGRHRNAWDFHIDGAQMVAAGEIEGLPVVAAKSEVGGGRRPVDYAAQLFAVWIHDPKPARSAAIDIALDIDLHAVGNPGLAAGSSTLPPHS